VRASEGQIPPVVSRIHAQYVQHIQYSDRFIRSVTLLTLFWSTQRQGTPVVVVVVAAAAAAAATQ
jgi:hypothetical protein